MDFKSQYEQSACVLTRNAAAELVWELVDEVVVYSVFEGTKYDDRSRVLHCNHTHKQFKLIVDKINRERFKIIDVGGFSYLLARLPTRTKPRFRRQLQEKTRR